jgi:2-polyprenyl-6-hydroxyphenyl methylase/3-demethylubiquinone-9 3-methyltransferase
VNEHTEEVKRGERFEFGANWTRFLKDLDETRIASAESSLCHMLGTGSLQGKTFVDIGCGSGLFSLAARRLGATVHSFDYDPKSVNCTAELRRRYFPDDSHWTVETGSALDSAYLGALGKFDVVYSWGVLHHTGDMASALANAAGMVAHGGKLFIAIYNDQGDWSRRWRWIKKQYNHSSRAGRFIIVSLIVAHFWWKPMLTDLLSGHPGKTWRQYRQPRGMSPVRDAVDWAGGYPFEVATPELIFDFYRARGFSMVKLKTCQNLGCNQFVFQLPPG